MLCYIWEKNTPLKYPAIRQTIRIRKNAKAAGQCISPDGDYISLFKRCFSPSGTLTPQRWAGMPERRGFAWADTN